MTPDQFGGPKQGTAPGVGTVGIDPGAPGVGAAPDNAHDALVLSAARSAAEQIRLQRAARRRYGRAAAAVAVCALGIGWWALTTRPPALREPPAQAALDPGVRAELAFPAASMAPANGATLSRAPVHLAWSDRAGPGPYRVSLHSTDNGLTWRSGPIEAAEMMLPAELKLVPGTTYLWAVEPQRPGAQVLGPYNFRIAD